MSGSVPRVSKTANATDISELFARDPLSHTDAEITKMIEYFREARKTFHLGNPQAGARKASTAKKPVVEIDLSDII